MKGHEWNKLFFEERMSNLNTKRPTTRGPSTVWRTIPGSNFTLQLSIDGELRRTTREMIMNGTADRLATPVHVDIHKGLDKLMAEVFPLNSEKLYDAPH